MRLLKGVDLGYWSSYSGVRARRPTACTRQQRAPRHTTPSFPRPLPARMVDQKEPNGPRATVSIEEPAGAPATAGKSDKSGRPPMFRAATAAVLMGHTRVAPDGAAAYGGDKHPIRAAIFKMLERPRSSTRALAFFSVVLVAITASTITWALSTVEGMDGAVSISIVEIICNAIFTFELTLRLFAMQGELKNLVMDMTFYVDVFSLLPFYIQVGVWISDASEMPQWAKMLRLLNVLRVLKLLR